MWNIFDHQKLASSRCSNTWKICLAANIDGLWHFHQNKTPTTGRASRPRQSPEAQTPRHGEWTACGQRGHKQILEDGEQLKHSPWWLVLWQRTICRTRQNIIPMVQYLLVEAVETFFFRARVDGSLQSWSAAGSWHHRWLRGNSLTLRSFEITWNNYLWKMAWTWPIFRWFTLPRFSMVVPVEDGDFRPGHDFSDATPQRACGAARTLALRRRGLDGGFKQPSSVH